MGGGWHPRGISLFKGARVKFSQPWAPSEFPISALPHYTSSPFPPDDRSRSQKPYPGGDLRWQIPVGCPLQETTDSCNVCLTKKRGKALRPSKWLPLLSACYYELPRYDKMYWNPCFNLGLNSSHEHSNLVRSVSHPPCGKLLIGTLFCLQKFTRDEIIWRYLPITHLFHIETPTFYWYLMIWTYLRMHLWNTNLETVSILKETR